MKYDLVVVKADKIVGCATFVKQINEKLDQGYKVIGEVSAINVIDVGNFPTIYFMQAVIKDN